MYGAGARRAGLIVRLCLAMSIRMAITLNGLGACEADGRAVVVEVGATAVLEGLRGRIEDA